MVGGSLRVLQLLLPLKLVTMIYIADILLKVALKSINQSYRTPTVLVIYIVKSDKSLVGKIHFIVPSMFYL